MTFTFYFLILNNPNNKNHLKQKAEKLGKNRKVMVIPQIIKIKRISAWTHNSKQFTVFLDGRKMPGRIGNGEERKIAVDPGFHELPLKMGLLGSNTVKAAGSLGQMPNRRFLN